MSILNKLKSTGSAFINSDMEIIDQAPSGRLEGLAAEIPLPFTGTEEELKQEVTRQYDELEGTSYLQEHDILCPKAFEEEMEKRR